jgi:hypothetical protein
VYADITVHIRFDNNDYSWLFRRSIVVDGNFSAEHMKMLRADEDVRLVNGEGYMVEERVYQEHLKASSDQKEVRFLLFDCETSIINLLVEIQVFELQGHQRCECCSTKSGSNWNWCLCMFTTWVFHSEFCGRLSERRKVRIVSF